MEIMKSAACSQSLLYRSLYLMALNFSEKQLWVATLEAIVEDVNASIKVLTLLSVFSINYYCYT